MKKPAYWSLLCYPLMLLFAGVGGIDVAMHGTAGYHALGWLMLAMFMLGVQPAWAHFVEHEKTSPGDKAVAACMAVAMAFSLAIAVLPVSESAAYWLLVCSFGSFMVYHPVAKAADWYFGKGARIDRT